ncbi:MAG: SCO family protein [Candidatus Thiodiazotropha sp.]
MSNSLLLVRMTKMSIVRILHWLVCSGCLVFVTTAIAEDSVASADSESENLPLIAPFKMDCVNRPGNNKSFADRFTVAAKDDNHVNSHTPEQHAHHMKMMASEEYNVLHAHYSIPDVNLISHKREVKTLADVLNTDRPVMLNFIFTTCTTICPVLSASFHQVQEQLGNESNSVSMVSITIDPDYDTPEQLQKYSERFSAGEQWQFYTGSYKDIVMVEKAFDIYRGSKMNHEPVTLIRTNKNSKWMRIDGLASAEDIIMEYKQILQPLSQ